MKIYLFFVPFLQYGLGSSAHGELNPCSIGYIVNKLGACEDINECQNSATACKNGQRCVNSPGR